MDCASVISALPLRRVLPETNVSNFGGMIRLKPLAQSVRGSYGTSQSLGVVQSSEPQEVHAHPGHVDSANSPIRDLLDPRSTFPPSSSSNHASESRVFGKLEPAIIHRRPMHTFLAAHALILQITKCRCFHRGNTNTTPSLP